ncbi:MAG: hypothetical protein ACI94Y_001407 [Maribacter sp.]|jgi:hypothetical protein
MKYFLTLLLALCTVFTSFSQDAKVYFDTASPEIRKAEEAKLEGMTNLYFQDKNYISLVGYCDKSGSEEYNLLLSQKRVNVIKDYFLKKGIPLAQIQTDYKGEQGVAKEDQEYRKVDIFMMKVSKEPVLKIKEDLVLEEPRLIENRVVIPEIKKNDVVISSNDFKEMTYDTYMDSIMPTKQIHILENGKENIIKGEKGTWIKLPENAFVDGNGEPAKGEIVVNLKEYYSKKDFVADRLSTISKGNLIKSGGMIHLEAKSMNKQLSLAKDKTIELLFPRMDQQYFTFYGQRMDDGSIDWEKGENDTQSQSVNLDDFDVTMTLDGNGLELVEKEVAKERNKSATFKGRNGVFQEITDSVRLEKINNKINYWKTKEAVSTRLKSNRIGYINCDRFMDSETSDTEILVEVADNVKATYGLLVFKDLNSVIEIRQQEKNIFFYNANLPLGKNVDLIIVGRDDDNGLYLYQKSFRLSKKNAEKIELVKSSYEKLDEILSNM